MHTQERPVVGVFDHVRVDAPAVADFTPEEREKVHRHEQHVGTLFAKPLMLYTELDLATMKFGELCGSRPVRPASIYAPTISFSREQCLMVIIVVPSKWFDQLTVTIDEFMECVLDFVASVRARIFQEQKLIPHCSVCETPVPKIPVYNYVKTVSTAFFIIICAMRCESLDCERYAQVITRIIRTKVFNSVEHIFQTRGAAPRVGDSPGGAEEGPNPGCTVPHACHVCGQSKGDLSLCGDCLGTVYCGKVCQGAHLAEHLKTCHRGRRRHQHACLTCGKRQTRMVMCACGKALYCNAKCRRIDWRWHRQKCSY